LRAIDPNNDGVINASDPGYSRLVVWRDLYGDGVSQPNEVSTLAQLGITSIDLSYRPTHTAVGDDLIIATASATMTDGSTRQIAEAVLDTDPTYSQYVGNLHARSGCGEPAAIEGLRAAARPLNRDEPGQPAQNPRPSTASRGPQQPLLAMLKINEGEHCTAF
jgi:hypothetical protein